MGPTCRRRRSRGYAFWSDRTGQMTWILIVVTLQVLSLKLGTTTMRSGRHTHFVDGTETLVLPTGTHHRLVLRSPCVTIGVFFDGTWNDKDDPALSRSNVAKLWSIYA